MALASLLGPGVGAQIPGLPGAEDVTAVRSEQAEARLIAHSPQGLSPGATLWLGLQLQHSPHWHSYWKNPGDSGLPTRFEWQLPPGVTAGDIQWPTPRKFPLGTLANYGYDGQVLLATPIRLPEDWHGDRLDVRLHASWLVCKTECIPEEGDFRMTLKADRPVTVHGHAFEEAARSVPKDVSPGASTAGVTPPFLTLTVDALPPSWRGQTLEAFPEQGNLIEPGTPWTQAWKGSQWQAQLPLHPMRSDAPTQLAVVLSAPHAQPAQGEPPLPSVRLTLPVTGNWPATAAPVSISPALEAALNRNAAAVVLPPSGGPGSLWLALAGALLGGLILNLMPCVFPVLAIKVLAFTQHASDGAPAAQTRTRRMHRASGLAYTLGVVLSFMALGGLLVGLRAAGEQLGWGFQLQSPAVVATLAALFTLIGLNLAGLFELGQVLPSAVAGLQSRHPVVDAFLTGMLATAVASPCTAPFMGASLGWAMTLPGPQALAVFAAIGLGLALPYLAASWLPGLAHALPRPGAWMNTFKQLMAFPMFATVVWLVWVLGQQSGIHGAAALLGWLVMLAMAVWAWEQVGRSRWWLGGLSTAALLALTVAWTPVVLSEESASPSPNAATSDATALTPGVWHPWSAQRLSTLRDAGRTVMVDYTAAWCVTCQYNKRTTLDQPALLADLARQEVILLRADWTRRDPAVTAALAEVGRNGVPTYAVYRASQPPLLLSELPSATEVRLAIGAH